MSIWSSEITEINRIYQSLKGQLPDLDRELERLIKTDDENIVLVYSRRCLEVIVTDLCETELNRSRKTEPLKGIIDKLSHEEKIPPNIIASMDGLNSLSAFGAHPKDFDPEQVKPVLNHLATIIKWYKRYKDSKIISSVNAAKLQTLISNEGQTSDEVESENRPSVLKIQASKDQIINKTYFPDVLKGLFRKSKANLILFFSVAIAVVATIVYFKVFKKDNLEKLRASGERISVAVLPFQNMTGDTTWNVWQDGIQDMLITSLSNSEELKVRQTESINSLIQIKGFTNYASITPSIASSVSQKLDADVFVFGNIKQAETTVRVYAQLIDSRTEEIIKSFQAEGSSQKKMIFHIIDSLAYEVKNFLIVSKLKQEVSREMIGSLLSTDSPEAFRYYIYGVNAFRKRDYHSAINMFLQSLAIDSNAMAIIYMSVAYYNIGSYEQGKKWCLRIYDKRDLMSLKHKIWTNWLYSLYFETPYEEIKYLRELLEIDDQLPLTRFILGNCYMHLRQYDRAIPEYENALEIYDRWAAKPSWIFDYTNLGWAYHMTGKYKKEKKLYKKAEQDFPDDPTLIYRQAILSLAKGDKAKAQKLIDLFIAIRREDSFTEARIMSGVADIYSNADIKDKAEEYYRKALSLEPDNPIRLNALAWFLIDNDRNIDEGLKLVDKALDLRPQDIYFLDTKGWGLYKQGNTREALEILQKAWAIKPVYIHEIFLHLEEVKKAVTSQ